MSTGQRMIGGGVKVSPLRFKRWMPICSCANWVAGSYDSTCPGIEVRTSSRRDWPVAVFSSLAMRSCRVCLALIIGHPRRAQAGLTLSPAHELAGPAVIAVKAALAPQGLNHVQAVVNGALFFRQLGLINSAKIDRGGLGPDTHSVADDDARVELHFEISAQSR